MPWATRGRRRYYFRRRTVKGHEVRRFFGSGPEAHLAAALDARRQDELEALRAARRQEQNRWQVAAGPLTELIDVTELLVRAALLAAGYHQHQRLWRRRRHVGPS
jgi:hypothetical protein